MTKAKETKKTDDKDMRFQVVVEKNVVAKIAGLAVKEVEGVTGMAGGIKDGITTILPWSKVERGVNVEVGTSEVAVDLSVVIQFGHNIPDVTERIKKNVCERIEIMTGYTVVEINISVSDIRLDEVQPEMEPEPVPEQKPSRVK